MSDRLLTPQQELFLSYYTDPKSETFGNAKQSALKAKYSQEYSENIMSLLPDWLSENIGSLKRLKKSEKNLDEVTNLPLFNEEGELDTNVLKERTKVDMFITETVGKTIYSKRSELTGAGGKDLKIVFDNAFNKDGSPS